MLLTIVRLMFFPLSRLPISLGIPLIQDRHPPHGVLIEPGVRLYEGGNVTICLLTHGIFLLSFFRCTHILFGMCSYDWVNCLILLSSYTVTLLSLNSNPMPFLFHYYWTGLYHLTHSCLLSRLLSMDSLTF